MSAVEMVVIGVLFAAGSYLLMERSLTRIALGAGVIGNGINVLIIATGSRPGEAPILGRDGELVDPMPQALVLTAIVIGFGLLSFLLALAWRNWTISENDEVEDDLEDRLIARRDDNAKSSAGSNHGSNAS